MSRIESTNQLAQLRLQYAAAQGAFGVARAAQQAADAAARQYLEMIRMLTGEQIGDGDQVHVDWATGEVTIEQQQHTTNGVAV